MLIIHMDGSRRKQLSISETGLSTKPARSLEKFTEGSGGQRPSAVCLVHLVDLVCFVYLVDF